MKFRKDKIYDEQDDYDFFNNSIKGNVYIELIMLSIFGLSLSIFIFMISIFIKM